MGSNSGDDDEQPIHTVTVSSFYMDKTEVTQAEYRKVMGKNPSHFSGCRVAPRGRYDPDGRGSHFGFRLVLSQEL